MVASPGDDKYKMIIIKRIVMILLLSRMGKRLFLFEEACFAKQPYTLLHVAPNGKKGKKKEECDMINHAQKPLNHATAQQ